jgi:branched-chain amino acid aminotransferase
VEERFTRDEAYIADEVFMTGTAAEVTPVREIDGRVIGDGSPGSITRALQEQFQAIVKGEVAEYRHWLTPVS